MAATDLETAVLGAYTFVAPGSGGEKSVKRLTLKPGGTLEYSVEGETAMETYKVAVTGEGSWRIAQSSGSAGTATTVVDIVFTELTKTNTPKGGLVVPGVTDGKAHVTKDDGLDIPVAELTDAPPASSAVVHKWKKVA